MKKIYWASLLFGLGLVLIYAFEGYYMDFIGVFSNAFPMFISGACAVASMFALRKYWEGLGSKLTRVWLLFSVGATFWFFGELTWGIYALVLGVDIPYPSIADAFWLFGYIPFFFALVSYLSMVRPAVSKEILAVSSATVSVGAVTSSFLFIIPAVTEETDTLTRITNVAYPSLDLLLLALSILGLMVFTTTKLKGKIEKVWVFLNAGILMNVVADSSFSYTTAQGTYYAGHPLELFFHFGYLAFLLAFYLHTKEL